ncbi:17968_t:CDS:2 [Funneliformis caledonium]|uniref:DNA replication complex GINS protein SLD5 n=1 Tax=Funneliformis caledonium TaxID=1117310 RepID=A0A9N8VCL3_9GLOM|nr:17968_t:CDS:2 [Funneliformis caledonium]
MSRIFSLNELGHAGSSRLSRPTRPTRELPDIDLDIDDLTDSDTEDEKDQETQLKDAETSNDYEILKRSLINEEFSPEILMYQDKAIDNLDKLIQEQDAVSKEMLVTHERKQFGMLLFSGTDRIKYIMEKYLLCRRNKIETQVLGILSSPIYKERLSTAELTHAEDYKMLLEDYLKAELKLPNDCLEDSIIKTFEKKPDLSKTVFCRVLKNIVPRDAQDTAIQHEPGDVIMDKYAYMRDALKDNSVELI